MKTETLRVRNVVDATRLGAWLRSGEGIGWLAAGTMPNSLDRVPFVYLFLACVFCYSCSFLFAVLFVCVFLLLSLELGSCSSDQTTCRIGNHVYYWVWLRPDRLMCKQQEQQQQRPNPSRETKVSGANRDREIFVFPVQLTMSRIGDLTRLIHTLAIYV